MHKAAAEGSRRHKFQYFLTSTVPQSICREVISTKNYFPKNEIQKNSMDGNTDCLQQEGIKLIKVVE